MNVRLMNPSPSSHRLSTVRRVLTSPAVLTALAILILGAWLTRWISSIGGPEAFRDQFGSIAPLVTVPIHIIVTLTPCPSDVICIANGTLYGFASGALLNWIGWWIAALMEFSIARRARTDLDLEQQLLRLPRWLQRFPVGHPGYLLLSRQIPWLGGHVSTLIPGAMGVSMSRFSWCSAIAVVPSSLLMAAIGAGLVKLATSP